MIFKKFTCNLEYVYALNIFRFYFWNVSYLEYGWNLFVVLFKYFAKSGQFLEENQNAKCIP